MVTQSILKTIKSLLPLEPEITEFDSDIIIFINGAIMALTQLGVGPSKGFVITGYDETWSDFIGDRIDIEAVKSYVYLKVKLIFDPPSMSYLIDAIKSQIAEYEFRLNVQVD